MHLGRYDEALQNLAYSFLVFLAGVVATWVLA
jgi:hypothetical protein